MESKNFQKYHLIYMFILSAVAIVWALIYMQPVLMPLVFAIFYYFASLPLMHFLEDKLKAPKGLSSAITTFLIGGFSVALILEITFSVKIFFLELGTYQESFLKFVDQVTSLAASYGFEVDRNSYYDFFISLPLKNYVTNLMGDTFSFLGNAFLTLIIYFFLMLGRSNDREQGSSHFIDEIAHKVSRYVIYKIIVSTLTGFLVWIILLSFGVKLALMFGILAFILNFIPSIGSIVATAIPVPMIALQFGFGFKFFLILALCSAVQLFIGNFLDPKLMGKDLDLHPIVIILSLIFWGLIWGLAGAFLAVPLTATLKLMLSKIETTKRLSEMLAGRL